MREVSSVIKYCPSCRSKIGPGNSLIMPDLFANAKLTPFAGCERCWKERWKKEGFGKGDKAEKEIQEVK